jgi:hypothetical protein
VSYDIHAAQGASERRARTLPDESPAGLRRERPSRKRPAGSGHDSQVRLSPLPLRVRRPSATLRGPLPQQRIARGVRVSRPGFGGRGRLALPAAPLDRLRRHEAHRRRHAEGLEGPAPHAGARASTAPAPVQASRGCHSTCTSRVSSALLASHHEEIVRRELRHLESACSICDG